MKLSIEVKIGIIAILALAATYWGLNFLKGRNVLKAYNEYTAFYSDVSGLEVNSQILLSGYRIGQVNSIQFNPYKRGEMRVKLGIRKNYKIPLHSVAQLFDADLMGTKAIRILLSESEDYHVPGDTMETDIKPGLTDVINQELVPVKERAEDLIAAMDTFMEGLNYSFDRESADDLKQSISNIRGASNEIDGMLDENGKISSMISDLESISSNIRKHNQQIARALANIAGISDSLAQSDLKSVINKTNGTLSYAHSVLRKIDSGEGTLGMLVNNDSLYQCLESTSAELDRLLKDLQENPRKYINVTIFGGKK